MIPNSDVQLARPDNQPRLVRRHHQYLENSSTGVNKRASIELRCWNTYSTLLVDRNQTPRHASNYLFRGYYIPYRPILFSAGFPTQPTQ
jgi:hypothetical protein